MAAVEKKQEEIVEITDGKFKYTLSKPTEIEGMTYTELEFDFEGLTGADMIEASRTRERIAPSTSTDQTGIMKDGIMPEMDRTYQAFVAAKAAGVHPNVILGLRARDFNAVTRATVIFLLGTAS